MKTIINNLLTSVFLFCFHVDKTNGRNMGVYDFFKGPCPNCPKDIDYYPKIGDHCGEIQTKLFSTPDFGNCFRDFFP